jgi:hypothetical protein
MLVVDDFDNLGQYDLQWYYRMMTHPVLTVEKQYIVEVSATRGTTALVY